MSDVVDAARGGAFGWPAVEARLTVELAADALCDPGFDGGADSPEGPNSARKGVGRLKLAALVLLLLRLPLLPTTTVATLVLKSSTVSSSDTHRSHSSHPRNVPKLLQLTMDTGETRSWKMHAKHTMKMMTEQTCCSITVESATSGQKS